MWVGQHMRHALLSGTWFLFGYIDWIVWQETQSPARHVPTRPQLMRAASCDRYETPWPLLVWSCSLKAEINKQRTNQTCTTQHSTACISDQVGFRSGSGSGPVLCFFRPVACLLRCFSARRVLPVVLPIPACTAAELGCGQEQRSSASVPDSASICCGRTAHRIVQASKQSWALYFASSPGTQGFQSRESLAVAVAAATSCGQQALPPDYY
jgi:hypothetical protein